MVVGIHCYTGSISKRLHPFHTLRKFLFIKRKYNNQKTKKECLLIIISYLITIFLQLILSFSFHVRYASCQLSIIPLDIHLIGYGFFIVHVGG